jgi:hypothetical protein
VIERRQILLGTLAGVALLAVGVARIAGSARSTSSRAGATNEVSSLATAGGVPGGVAHGGPAILIRRGHQSARPTRHHRQRAARYPTVTTEPRDQSLASGDLASFTATATGTPAPKEQWQRSVNHGRSWKNVAGARGVSYSFTASSSENSSEYRAVFSNAAGKADTNAATLTITQPPVTTSPPPSEAEPPATASPPPVTTTPSPSEDESPVTTGAPQIATQPASETVAVDSRASFTAAASGNPAPTVQWEVSSNGGSSWSIIAGATSTSYSFTASSTQNADEYRAVFDNAHGSATTNPATLTVAEESGNWSGYAALGGGFSAVSGSWTVPSVTCTGGATTYSSQWIGIDGYSSDTVEQDGTGASCQAGTPYYNAWYEMYGDEAVNDGYEVPLSSSSYPVSPGDAMIASVSFSGSKWTLAIADTTRAWNYSVEIVQPAQPPARSSAEWIVERPEVDSSLSALSDFGSTGFTGASATDNATSGPISAFSFQPLEMDGSTLLAAPGALDPTGEQFGDTWYASS